MASLAMKFISPNNCPIRERTGDGRSVGRCWFWCGKNETCPRHGDVSRELKAYRETGKLQEWLGSTKGKDT